LLLEQFQGTDCEEFVSCSNVIPPPSLTRLKQNSIETYIYTVHELKEYKPPDYQIIDTGEIPSRVFDHEYKGLQRIRWFHKSYSFNGRECGISWTFMPCSHSLLGLFKTLDSSDFHRYLKRTWLKSILKNLQ
jgi:hypothetical protein